MNIKTFILAFIFMYILIGLPAMLEFGYVIDWTQEATLPQRLKGYVMEGLTNHYLIKIIISIITGAAFSLFFSKRKGMRS